MTDMRARRSRRREGGYLHPHAGAAGPAPEESLAFAAGEEAFQDLIRLCEYPVEREGLERTVCPCRVQLYCVLHLAREKGRHGFDLEANMDAW